MRRRKEPSSVCGSRRKPDRRTRPRLAGVQARRRALGRSSGAAAWEVDLFGGLRRGEEAAQAEAEAAEAAQLGTRVTVAAEAADAYLQIRGDQARLQRRRTAGRHGAPAPRSRRIAQGERHGAPIARSPSRKPCSPRPKAPFRSCARRSRPRRNRLAVLMGAQPGADAAELDDAAALPADAAHPGVRRRPASAARRHRRRAPSRRRQRPHRRGDRRVLSQAVAQRRPRLRSGGDLTACSRRARSSRSARVACAGGCSISVASTPRSKALTPPAVRRCWPIAASSCAPPRKSRTRA